MPRLGVGTELMNHKLVTLSGEFQVMERKPRRTVLILHYMGQGGGGQQMFQVCSPV